MSCPSCWLQRMAQTSACRAQGWVVGSGGRGSARAVSLLAGPATHTHAPACLPACAQEWRTLQDSSATGEWKESVSLVFEYFCERTPRSFVEQRGTSLVWNYKYAGERSALGGRAG